MNKVINMIYHSFHRNHKSIPDKDIHRIFRKTIIIILKLILKSMMILFYLSLILISIFQVKSKAMLVNM